MSRGTIVGLSRSAVVGLCRGTLVGSSAVGCRCLSGDLALGGSLWWRWATEGGLSPDLMNGPVGHPPITGYTTSGTLRTTGKGAVLTGHQAV